MWLWLLSHWRVGAVTAAFLASFLFGAWITSNYYQNRIAAIELAHAEGLAKAQATVIEKQKEQAKITAEVSNDYQSKIAALRRRFELELGRLRAEADRSSPLPAVSDATAGHNGGAGADGLPRRVPETIATLMYKADEQTQRLIACQDWIRKSGSGEH